MDEKFRTIQNYPNYRVSNTGRIWSNYSDRFLKPKWSGPKKYPHVRLTDPDGNPKSIAIHTLVTRAFLGPIPLYYTVDHIDGNPCNNILSNLRYCTLKENLENSDYKRRGLTAPNSLFKAEDIEPIMRLYIEKKSILKVAKHFKAGHRAISNALRGITYSEAYKRAPVELRKVVNSLLDSRNYHTKKLKPYTYEDWS